MDLLPIADIYNIIKVVIFVHCGHWHCIAIMENSIIHSLLSEDCNNNNNKKNMSSSKT